MPVLRSTTRQNRKKKQTDSKYIQTFTNKENRFIINDKNCTSCTCCISLKKSCSRVPANSRPKRNSSPSLSSHHRIERILPVPARVLLLNSVNVKMDIGVTRVHTKTKTKEHRMSGSPMIGDYQIQRGFPPGGTRFTKFLNPNLNWTKYNKSFLTNTEY